MGSHSVTCHLAEVWIPPLPTAEAGTRFSDPGGMQGWVDLCHLKAAVWDLNKRPDNCKSNALLQRQHATHVCWSSLLSGQNICLPRRMLHPGVTVSIMNGQTENGRTDHYIMLSTRCSCRTKETYKDATCKTDKKQQLKNWVTAAHD